MKNVHLLPTDKPSRLFKLAGDLHLHKEHGIDHKRNQHIYITSDEEINQQTKPCWCINTIKNTWNDDLIYYQGAMPQYHFKGFKKIILTTDQDLIADGVQAIDYDFLEWFVKNPSCEDVEVKKEYITPLGDIVETCYDNETLNYKITIPKEELNQETLEEVAREYYKRGQLGFEKAADTEMAFLRGGLWQQEQFGKSEFLQKLRATKSDAEARRLIFEQFKNK